MAIQAGRLTMAFLSHAEAFAWIDYVLHHTLTDRSQQINRLVSAASYLPDRPLARLVDELTPLAQSLRIPT